MAGAYVKGACQVNVVAFRTAITGGVPAEADELAITQCGVMLHLGPNAPAPSGAGKQSTRHELVISAQPVK
ncbi:hypothetical protein WJX84_004576 [Apatococcus fuscideae]|uniref:Uncharacterized protein n=1 Tax=Apatococcus fuscideae TaxID=2026836 RepID=A0AAW1TAC2_9CHLO